MAKYNPKLPIEPADSIWFCVYPNRDLRSLEYTAKAYEDPDTLSRRTQAERATHLLAAGEIVKMEEEDEDDEDGAISVMGAEMDGLW